jgi:hypothetical protein
MKLRSLGFAFAALLVASLAAPAWAAEKKVKMADLPPAVQQAVKEQSRGATLRGLSTETENGKTTYEAQLTVNGHSRDVEFDADGKVLEVEDTVAMGSLSADVKAGGREGCRQQQDQERRVHHAGRQDRGIRSGGGIGRRQALRGSGGPRGQTGPPRLALAENRGIVLRASRSARRRISFCADFCAREILRSAPAGTHSRDAYKYSLPHRLRPAMQERPSGKTK